MESRPSYIAPLLAAALLAGALQSCGPSSPRFASGEKPRKPSITGEQPPSTNDGSGESAVDPREAERVLSGTRDFRRENNAAISPLDQSRMMREISKYMGVRYAHGGEGGEGIDCSGYTMVVYKNSLNRLLPRRSQDQWKTGRPVAFDDLQFGDLIFFNTTGESASHVGIYLGDNLFAHASTVLGVTISSLESSYYRNRYEGARRIVE